VSLARLPGRDPDRHDTSGLQPLPQACGLLHKHVAHGNFVASLPYHQGMEPGSSDASNRQGLGLPHNQWNAMYSERNGLDGRGRVTAAAATSKRDHGERASECEYDESGHPALASQNQGVGYLDHQRGRALNAARALSELLSS
jgi:hypothetical protein